jgi:uncharacterized protein involved in exopolysaccharide biosynthesis
VLGEKKVHVTQTGAKPQKDTVRLPEFGEVSLHEVPILDPGEIVARRFRLLWEKRRFLFWTSAAGLLLGMALALLLPARYESTAKLMPPDNTSTSMAMLASLTARSPGGLGLVAGDLLGLQSSGELFVGILESQTIRSRVVDQFKLEQVYELRHREDARSRLGENTRILEDRRSGIITLTVSDHDPARAAALANAYVTNLNQLVAELSTSSAHRERVFLEERLANVQQGLEDSEKQFGQFASKNHAINVAEQGKAMVDAAASLQGQLIAAQAELEGLRQLYTENNPRVRAMRARVDEIHGQLEKMGGNDEGAGTRAQETTTLYPSLQQLPLLGITYADLSRRMKIQEAVFESLTQQYEIAKVEEAKETPSVKVLDQGEIPDRKTFPPRFMITVLSAILFFVGGAVWVQASARWAAMNPQDPRKILMQEVFASAKTRVLGTSQNGVGLRGTARRVLEKLGSEVEVPGEAQKRD